MNNILSFGKHAGKTFEWLFFNNPSYAQFIYDNDIHRQRGKFSEEEGRYFLELFRRASCLAGICRWCKEKPLTRRGLSSLLSGVADHVGFYCDACEHPEHAVKKYDQPSFFVDEQFLAQGEQKQIVTYIKNRYIGNERLTQKKMEEFFHSDGNFVHATPRFFTRKEVLAV